VPADAYTAMPTVTTTAVLPFTAAGMSTLGACALPDAPAMPAFTTTADLPHTAASMSTFGASALPDAPGSVPTPDPCAVDVSDSISRLSDATGPLSDTYRVAGLPHAGVP
jgi:hypothetical protein